MESAPRTTGSFAALLRRYRLDRHLTQEELAHTAGLSVRALRNAELGRVIRPRRDSVKRLSDALHLTDPARRALTEAARVRRVPVGGTSEEPTRTVVLEPDGSLVVVLRKDDGEYADELSIGTTPTVTHGQPAIRLTVNRGARSGSVSSAISEPPDAL